MVVAKIQAKLKEVDEKVKTWVAAQPAHIEVALVTAASSLQGGFIGVLMGTFAPDMPTPPGPTGALTPDAQHAMKQMQVRFQVDGCCLSCHAASKELGELRSVMRLRVQRCSVEYSRWRALVRAPQGSPPFL